MPLSTDESLRKADKLRKIIRGARQLTVWRVCHDGRDRIIC